MTAVSVMIPSRGRPGPLAECIASMRNLAADPGSAEFLVALDPDDPSWRETSDMLTGHPASPRLWTAPERFGYPGLHLYYNHLASMASGDWLMMWNDDARMITRGWDQVIAAQRPAILWPQANHAFHANIFSVLPRSWAQAMGHVAMSPHCDTWLQRIGEYLGCMAKIPVAILHDRFDVTGGHDDQTYAEGRGQVGPEGMIGDFGAHRDQLQADAEIIRGLLNGKEG